MHHSHEAWYRIYNFCFILFMIFLSYTQTQISAFFFFFLTMYRFFFSFWGKYFSGCVGAWKWFFWHNLSRMSEKNVFWECIRNLSEKNNVSERKLDLLFCHCDLFWIEYGMKSFSILEIYKYVVLVPELEYHSRFSMSLCSKNLSRIL